MLPLLCIFLPCIVCITFGVLFSLRNDKTTTDKILLDLSFCSAVYFFAETNYISVVEDYTTLVLADIASQYARPLIPPLMVLCLHSMMGRIVWRWWMTCAFALSIMIGTVSMCVCFIMGIDNAANYVEAMYDNDGMMGSYANRIQLLYDVFCVWIYRLMIVVYSLIGIGRIAYLFVKTRFKWREIPDFLFRCGDIEPAHLMGMLYIIILVTIFVKLCIGRYWFCDHQCCASMFCIVRAMLVFFVGYVGLHSDKASISIGKTDACDDTHETEEKTKVSYLDMLEEGGTDIVRFGEIESKRLFCENGLTIEMCAERIGTNRTYLSRYITDRYGVSFREYINGLRIEYSKQYMMQNPTHKQEVVAEECGFADAPQFNKKFKQMVGKSPRMWVVMQG